MHGHEHRAGSPAAHGIVGIHLGEKDRLDVAAPARHFADPALRIYFAGLSQSEHVILGEQPFAQGETDDRPTDDEDSQTRKEFGDA